MLLYLSICLKVPRYVPSYKIKKIDFSSIAANYNLQTLKYIKSDISNYMLEMKIKLQMQIKYFMRHQIKV